MGPNSFTNTFLEFDLRTGGRWKFILHGPGNGNYNNEVKFTTIVNPAMIAWKRISRPLFHVIATLDEAGPGKTRIIFRQIFDMPEECRKIKVHVVEKNAENFDRLEEELLRMKADQDRF